MNGTRSFDELVATFWRKVERTHSCWLWTAGRSGKGYGSFCIPHMKGTKNVAAHRFAYELMVGPIPEDLELDHLCGVRECVNPRHLEAVTHLVNVRRGLAARSGRKKNVA